MKRYHFDSRLFAAVLLRIILISLWFVAGISGANALDVPKWQGYVNDYANMISPGTKTAIEGDLRKLEQADSTQIYILTVPSLEGEVLEEFSVKVFDVWKAGRKGLDNGVILIVAQKERKIRIEVGRGLEGKLTDLAAGRVIDQVMKPKFKTNDFDGGFAAGVSSLIQTTKGEFKAPEIPVAVIVAPESCSQLCNLAVSVVRDPGKGPFFFIASFALIIALKILKALKVINSKKVSAMAGASVVPVIAAFTVYPGVNFFTLTSLFALPFYAVIGGVFGLASSYTAGIANRRGSGSYGGGDSASDDWSSSDSGGDSGGGDSGGGGGDSGGGGASGDY